jgi:hypothetical protein
MSFALRYAMAKQYRKVDAEDTCAMVHVVTGLLYRLMAVR